MPTTSGSSAARPRKNSSESSNSSGNASSSARAEVLPDGLADLQARHRGAADRDARCLSSKAVSAASATSSSSALALTEPVTRRCGRPRRRRPTVAPATPGRPASRSAAACCALLQSGAFDQQDDAGRRVLAGRPLELPVGAGGLRRVGGEAAAGLERAGDGAADHAREDDEGEQDEQGAPRAGGGEISEAFEHASHRGPRIALAHLPGGVTCGRSRILPREYAGWYRY